jgi:hypothetical protein
MMAVTYNDTPENVAYLAALFGYELITAKAWIRLEGQGAANPTNPLNIRNSLEMIGQTPGGFAYFETPFHGLYSARKVIERNAPAYGYDTIMARAWNRDPLSQAKAIERSSWAGGNYGSDWANNVPGSIYKYVEANGVQQITTTGNIQIGNLITVPANVEILDGNGKVVAKTTADTPGIPYLGPSEDGWSAVLWSGGIIRFVRASYPVTAVDPCADEAKAAVDALNVKIDAAQGA